MEVYVVADPHTHYNRKDLPVPERVVTAGVAAAAAGVAAAAASTAAAEATEGGGGGAAAPAVALLERARRVCAEVDALAAQPFVTGA